MYKITSSDAILGEIFFDKMNEALVFILDYLDHCKWVRINGVTIIKR